MAANKSIDPRFDPAFQRGYADNKGDAHSDTVRAARTVDALRDDAADAQYSHPQPRTPFAARPQAQPLFTSELRSPVRSSTPAGQPATSIGPGLDEQSALAPQSHYVDDAAALAEISPAGYGKSLARNPWIYVLWSVGVFVTIGGVSGQLWAYSQLYSQTGLNVDDYGLFTEIQGLAPIAATVGALCIVGALMIHALNWMHKNP